METPCDITQEDTMFDVEMVSLSIPPFTSSFSLFQDHDAAYTQADPTTLSQCHAHSLSMSLVNMTNVCAENWRSMLTKYIEMKVRET